MTWGFVGWTTMTVFCSTTLRLDLLLLGGGERPGPLRLLPHALDRVHDVRLLVEEGVPQVGGPLDVVAETLHDVGERRHRLDGRVPGLLRDRVCERLVLQSLVLPEPLLELDDLERVGRGHERLREQRVGVQGDGRDQRVELVRRGLGRGRLGCRAPGGSGVLREGHAPSGNEQHSAEQCQDRAADPAGASKPLRDGHEVLRFQWRSIDAGGTHMARKTTQKAPDAVPNAEQARLDEAREKGTPWRKWGPYLSERQWGTVREDYSEGGDAWNYFTHDQARSRAYRWGEDGLAGVSDDRLHLCFALALWNGKDAILKERLFGLSNSEGNHGEDVKEVYFYLDGTPTHSYMKYLYKYPQAAFPYGDLVKVNGSRSRKEMEYELLDTGVFDGDRYFDVFVEYAKGGTDDLLVKITAVNRGPEASALHLLPTLWFRNDWSSWIAEPADKPDAPPGRRTSRGAHGRRVAPRAGRVRPPLRGRGSAPLHRERDQQRAALPRAAEREPVREGRRQRLRGAGPRGPGEPRATGAPRSRPTTRSRSRPAGRRPFASASPRPRRRARARGRGAAPSPSVRTSRRSSARGWPRRTPSTAR